MRKLALVLTGLCLVLSSFAAVEPPVSSNPPLKASEIYFPIGKNGELISLMELATIKPREMQKFTGKKMKFFDRIGFKMAQKKLRESIDRDGTFNKKKVKKMMKKFQNGGSGFHIGGFALGFLLGLIGVLIAYLINDDLKSTRVKWAWIGWAAWVVILI